MRKIFIFIALILLLASLCACSNNGEDQSEPPAFEAGTLTIIFDYTKQSGYASNQFAVWIEDMDGNLIKTLYATRFTADGGYKNRPDSIPLWVGKSDIASMAKTDVDAITGATPKEGTLSYVWDLTDSFGNAVAPSKYKFVVEGNLRWKNRVIYSGIIDVSSGDATVEAEAEYFYETSGDQPALSDDAPENTMISAVAATWRIKI